MLLEGIALDMFFCLLISFVEGRFNSIYDSRKENQIWNPYLIPLFEMVAEKKKNCGKWKNMFGFLFTGVAEQFALAEAAMNVWSMDDGIDQPSTSLQGLSTEKPHSAGVSAIVLWTANTYRPVRHFCWIHPWSL